MAGSPECSTETIPLPPSPESEESSDRQGSRAAEALEESIPPLSSRPWRPPTKDVECRGCIAISGVRGRKSKLMEIVGRRMAGARSLWEDWARARRRRREEFFRSGEPRKLWRSVFDFKGSETAAVKAAAKFLGARRVV